MAIVLKAMILCATDDAAGALQSAFTALNGAVFESSSPVIDFALGIEQVVEIEDPETYQDGEFVALVPGAALLATANDVSLPC